MREHRFDNDEAALRPKSARLDETSTSRPIGSAAAQGRPDVLGPEGLSELQRAAGNAGVNTLVDDEPSPVHDAIAGGGRPLDPDVRSDMESRLGHDFGDVRVHDDAAANRSAGAVHAHAYTVGSNVVFQRDMYNPGSADGRVMLAHELTHVVQQRSGAVDGAPAPGGISVSDPSDRFEREAAANAERVAGSADSVQRDEVEEEPEEPSIQGTFPATRTKTESG
ncbi:uncharacterized protein DUF4157 [Rhodococcus sp. AG1013]|uniref:eCIS core domain-containing protein n=1 Tax=Rhodococcus sp. AG1013 TaxID=2183996 RepID=UPI000E0B2E0F|nr:DUF4157 domain-containing protein [Rhodococcus sp. AG1013]RDI17187.1 uncharacterized protein DUF4157 [Rhodococcus sp. AG1013]